MTNSNSSRSDDKSSSEIKTYVLDTNVLLHDPKAIHVFGNNRVVIPIVVIEELDRFKKDLSETGRNARHLSRNLDQLRKHRPLSDEVPLPDGGTLVVDLCEVEQAVFSWPGVLEKTEIDNIILAVARDRARRGDGPVIVVSKDVNVRIKADALGLRAEDYEHSKVDIEELYTGATELLVDADFIDAIFRENKLGMSTEGLYPNQYVQLNAQGSKQSALVRVCTEGGSVQLINRYKQGLWGLHARNREQRYALDALMDDNIKLVTMVGKAGTGKTLLAIAAGLEQVADRETFHKLLISRPVYPLGKDIGFLPGEIKEKLSPWMKPIYDAVEFLVDANRSQGRAMASSHQELSGLGLMEIEPLTYIRGRSIPYQFFVLDEAQNLTPHEVKSIVTRAGEGTKMILTGDPYQIDNPYVDSASNGLSYLVEKFKGQGVSAHITLMKGERSLLAETAANLL